jgi:ABC-2 type transport system ATP-binding protein
MKGASIMAVIQIDHLTKDYGHNRGVFDVSFKVEKGEVYGFLGPNGAGKTTAIRHIMGFSRPQAGQTFVNRLDSWKYASEIQKGLGYLPGEIALPESMKGTEFIQMMAELRGLKDRTYTNYLIKKFELEPSGSLKRMSLGMKRKLGIVTAFMHDPSILVLDEPTSGLDPFMQNVFIEFIKEEKEKGKTILLSSHIFKEIDATCDKISIIKDGRLVSSFVADDLRNSKEKTFKMEFHTIEFYERFTNEIQSISQFQIISVKPYKNQAIVSIPDANINEFVAIISNYDIKFFSEIKFTLEDYFMKFYDRKAKQGGGINENAVN